MKYILFLIVVGFFFADVSLAKNPPAATQTWTGTLSDKMCAKRLKGDPVKLASHTKMCMTEAMCAKSGYGVVVDGKFLKFDKKGDELATAFLVRTTRERNMEVVVTGTMNGSTIKVTEIKEKSQI